MGIVVTELPYMVGPEKIIEQIKKAVDDKRLTGIADVKDLTDLANGTRLVIEVKNGINPEALLEQLFKVTKLEDTFAINAVALVEGQPRTTEPEGDARGLPRPPTRGDASAHPVPAQEGRGPPPPGAGADDRHRRHRRRHRHHPLVRRRGRGPRPAHRWPST